MSVALCIKPKMFFNSFKSAGVLIDNNAECGEFTANVPNVPLNA
jgi:hypothetical protein